MAAATTTTSAQKRAPTAPSASRSSASYAYVSGSASESAALEAIKAASYRESRGPTGTHRTLRKIALASSIGFAVGAIWREAVAESRERDYEQAILGPSAASFRESVRDAERERNVLAILSAAGLSVVAWTFVY